jgi:Protein of unknown function (DUF2950)
MVAASVDSTAVDLEVVAGSTVEAAGTTKNGPFFRRHFPLDRRKRKGAVMWRANDLVNSGNFSRVGVAALLLSALLAVPGLARQSSQGTARQVEKIPVAPQSGQKTFASPQEAARALFAAAKGNNEGELLQLLGPDGKDVVSSGDAAQDERSRANFVKAYEEMNRLVKEPDGSVSLYIGSRNWPYPIPIANAGSQWFFDTRAGEAEILFRRIGRNEISAMRICDELVAAQKDFIKQHGEYAQKIFSDAGKQDGLYWTAENGQPQSPIGPLVAQAVSEAHPSNRQGPPVPYRGYYFHILTQAQNGQSYLADGKMTKGFAFVAYPAQYRSSGVMTFLVDQNDVIYEKDLGKDTATAAAAMNEYNPGPGWQKTEKAEEQATSEPAPK